MGRIDRRERAARVPPHHMQPGKGQWQRPLPPPSIRRATCRCLQSFNCAS
ncbi:hypothetical protein BURCENK562V_C6746 [Burkholderia cenocepacia K56-2Valvano]|nr:hypothetical protein BURCENK562V_C6746 [Burkholderia cenocepacia K56-2Valvano]